MAIINGERAVAIVGVAHRLPGLKGEAPTSTALWRHLSEGHDLVTTVDPSRWSRELYLHPRRSEPGTSYTFAAGSIGDVSGFDAAFFGISPREAAQMDPQQRLLLELVWEAFENAGVPASTVRGKSWGVYVGMSTLDYAYRRADDLAGIDAASMTGNTASIAANRISYVFDLRGPSMVVDTACSSSLVAFHQACQSIRCGESSAAVVGGVNLHLHPYPFIGFSKASMLSPTGRCRVFDKDSDGYVRSEGGAIVLLKPLEQALADGNRVLAVVAATGVNSDGHKKGLTVPSHSAQAELLRQVYQRAGIEPGQIDYLEAHGTGTPVGDPIEALALGEALGRARPPGLPLPIGSVKSNLGHLEAASGMAGLVKVLLAVQHRCVPPTIHLDAHNPSIRFAEWNLAPVTRSLTLPKDRRLVFGLNSFGFGGANAHAVLTSFESGHEAVLPPPGPSMQPPLLLSARSAGALRDLARRMAEHLQDRPEQSVYDVAYSVAFHRDAHAFRLQANAADRAELIERLAAFAQAGSADAVFTGSLLPHASAPAFVYGGNGSQWAGMGALLLRQEPAFRRAVEEVDALFRANSHLSILSELQAPPADSRLDFTKVAQPALFAMQVGLTRLLLERGIRPGAVCGHSIGEVAAAWACGALSLPQAVTLVYQRSAHQARTRGAGQMTAISLGASELARLLDSLSSSVAVAGINSPRSVTVAGPCAALATLESELLRRKIPFRRLALDYAFHSPAMDPIRPALERSLAGSPALEARAAHTAFYSTVTGGALAGDQLNPHYWWRNVRDPVRLHDAVQAMIESGINVFVEVGPDAVLHRYLDECVQGAARDKPGFRALVHSTMRRGDAGLALVDRVQRELLLAGAPVDISRIFPVAGRFVDLPTYPWQRERHWHPTTGESVGLLERHPVHPLLGYPVAGSALLWENHLDTARLPMLADHAVGGATVLAAAGFAEMALAAGFQWEPSGSFALEDLEIAAPLLLSADRSSTTRFQIDASDGRFTISSRERSSDDPWIARASGRLVRGPGPVSLVPIQPPQRPADVTAQRHYETAAALGLQYGPAFRSVSGVWLSERSALAALATPEAVPAEPGQAVPLAAYLDGAFQLLADLMLGQATPQADTPALLPVRIERLQVFAPHRHPGFGQAVLVRHGPRSLVADFTLYDEGGQAVALARNVRFRAMPLRRNGAEPARLYAMRAVPMPRRLPAGRAQLPPVREFAQHCAPRLHAPERTAARRRYVDEVEPLLDVLCAAFAERALRQVAGEAAVIDPAQLIAGGAVMPEADSFLRGLLQMLAEQGAIEPTGARWAWCEGADTPRPEDVWASLVFDYPEHASIAARVGSVGLRLGARLHCGPSPAGAAQPDQHAEAWVETLTRDQAADIGLALADVIRRAAAGQGEGARLRILCLAPPSLVERVALASDLDLDRCDLVIGARATQQREPLHGLLRRRPGLSVRQADLDHPGDTAEEPGGSFDIVLLAHGVAHAADPGLGLRNARRLLADGGLLVLLENFACRPLDFICGSDPRWWQQQDDGESVASRLRPPHVWCEALGRSGFIDAQAVTDVAEAPGSAQVATGPYLIFARAAAREEVPERAPVPPAATWLVLQDGSGYSAELGEELDNELSTRGQRVVRVLAAASYCAVGEDRFALDPGCAQEWTRLIEALRAAGREPEGWIHLHGLNLDSAHQTLPAQLSTQEARAAALVAWLQACGAAAIRPATWAVGAGASCSLLPESVRRSHLAAASDPVRDAALWGTVRVAANEFPDIRIRWVDLAEPQPSLANAAMLACEVLEPDAEDEVFLIRGARFVPRLGLGHVAAVGGDNAAQPAGFRLEAPVGGSLNALAWQRYELGAPGPGQVEIEVKAAGLNFRDVMYAIGALPDEALEDGFSGATLGMEASGVVTRVGSGVGDVAPGDAVIAFAPAAFSNRVLTPAAAVMPKPPEWTFAAAATVPTAFFTAYYALSELARLCEGERVLIHGAAGGVGIAAIQVAKHLGAEVFATAGTLEKRDFVRLLGAQQVFDSRSFAFADEVLQATGGEGVDVIVNSLAGEAVNRGLRVLHPFGRFVELGKRDFYENTRIGLRPFRNNISYFGVDADRLMVERPALARRVLAELVSLFAGGSLHPLPYRAFCASEVAEAFRYMRESRQIGKVVVAFPAHFDPPAARSAARPEPEPALRGDGTYLVTGGLGGFGLRTAQWLVEHGARHLALLGRRGPAAPEAQQALAQFDRQGVSVAALACDVTDGEAVARALARIRETMPPLCGVIHAATVMDDALIGGLKRERLHAVLAPKVLGAAHLDQLTRNDDLDFFVLYSSATTLLGNPGQAGYVAANMVLEALASRRRARGQRAACVLWGPIADAGYLAHNAKVQEGLEARLGGRALPAADALRVLGRILAAQGCGGSPCADPAVLDVDWNTLGRHLPGAAAPKFSDLMRLARLEDPGLPPAEDLRRWLDSLGEEKLLPALIGILTREIGAILRIAPERIEPGVSLYDVGMDSLMALELAMALDARLGIKLPEMALGEGPTVERLAQRVIRQLRPASADEGTRAPADGLSAAVRTVAARHAGEVSAAAVDAFSAELRSGQAPGEGSLTQPDRPEGADDRGAPA